MPYAFTIANSFFKPFGIAGIQLQQTANLGFWIAEGKLLALDSNRC